MNDISCSIVRDLMPLYIEGLTSEATNEFIDNHMKTCDECRMYLNDITQDTEINIKISEEKILDSGEVVINKIKKSQDRIKYTFIIFSILVAVINSILGKGLMATIPLIVVVPCVLKTFYDEDRVILITSIISQLVIAIATDNLEFGLFMLPMNVICVSSGLALGKFIKNII